MFSSDLSKPLWGSELALAIADYAKQHKGPVLVVTPSQFHSYQLEDELGFFTPEKTDVLLFPEWETLPYDPFSAHEDLLSSRIELLNRAPKLKHGIMIASAPSLMNRLPPKDFIAANVFHYHLGDTLDVDTFRNALTEHGYRANSQVFEHGEFAIRGAIIDVFPMGSDLPYRIELFDDEIESLRSFDPDTQTSIEKIEAIKLLPAHEFSLNEDSRTRFRNRFRENFAVNPAQCPMYQDVSEGVASSGLEYFIPLFFDETTSFADYLPANTHIIRLPALNKACENYWQEIKHRHEQLSHDVTRPILPPSQGFFAPSDVFLKLNQHENHDINLKADSPFPNLMAEVKETEKLQRLKQYLGEQVSQRVLFTAHSKGRREVLKQWLKSQNIETHTIKTWSEFLETKHQNAITIAPLDQGLVHDEILLITETQLLGEQASQRRSARKSKLTPENDIGLRSVAELNEGEAIVHIDHGVGRYHGLETIEHGSHIGEFIKIQYANSNLFVPVTSLHLVSRYSAGDSENAPLHSLGSDKWQKEKRKAKEKASDVAAELLAIYAQREARGGFAFNCTPSDYEAFCSQFPFTETVDQERAIEAILHDMAAAKPMDRLLCGDVGFGKTEVAMRAAFIAVMNHKQVAVLTPTTLLAQQHFQTFSDRFADFPVNIKVLSRFVTPKQQKETIDALAAGKVDIVISTHKILSKDIAFNALGLLVIDEEHRFGVKQKEQLKAMRTEVDILTMTATPIPRTLNMAFATLRDLSIIATPPARRLAVKTFIQKRQEGIIRDAILREIMRGGQVYFLHNNVETIEKTARHIETLVPEARVVIGHGQMHERELEKTMVDFAHRRFNVLVATTIIETGIDIPTANTIIIDRADKFGLAQLHQLRGRVGRSHHQAYAYLMIPDPKSITKEAQKRLEAIGQHEDLGAGFMLATQDLEIRGAGELLGESQSGEMHAVGFSLYMSMLERAVESIKNGKMLNLDEALHEDIDIDVGINALIPEDYLPDIHLRLMFYQRISTANDEESLQSIKIEMIDRLGLLPKQAENLFTIQRVKQLCHTIDIKALKKQDSTLKITFHSKPNINTQALLTLINTNERYRFMGPVSIALTLDNNESVQTDIERLSKTLCLEPD
ncbi:MAG: transcription-repair coupling factor [Gammaproteobacteria bacterium CG11_big_fil_rev_8_21_14_0_20_46_22]|nr:MAG: transcription-repair coupling factor [Gammaproteobacteria bacterium CG12_big_fil_rev_8_21_14_0_65_46_12]PIR11439.1 MAG: transcription-repair coupling factor [Gammaproteobacteria bacterium CG11_big_fil_rev_8_21_14_0_20_46_22]